MTFGGTGLTTVTGGTATPSNWFSPTAAGIGAGYYINITKTGGLSGLSFNVLSNGNTTVAPSGATYTGGTLTANFTGNTASNYVLILSTGQTISGCTFTNGATAFTCPSTSITGTPTVVVQVSVQGVWENITANGITINSNALATISGTYQLSSSVTGSPIVATGTITLSGNNGIQSPSINGATPLVLAGNGTATLNSVSASNWYAPTTSNVGSGYYILINQTGGTSGYSFSAGTGAYTNITNGGLTIGISGSGATLYSVTGTYIIASDSGGVNQLGSGTITLIGSNVQSPNWSGTTPLKLNGNGSATLNGVGTSSWLSPNVANSGSGFYIDITRTGGTSGVNFSAAQGSWTNITNSGLSIGMTGYTGDVGTVTVNGNWQISNSSSGTPVLGSGTISLSVSGLTVLHLYTTAGSGTETIPTGSTTCVIEVWSGVSGGGGGSNGNGSGGGGGGGGAGPAYARSSYTVTGHNGQTMAYTVGAAGTPGTSIYNGTAGNGTAGGSSSVSSGTFTVTTMNATAGGFGTGGSNLAAGTGGAASTASGGNATNQNGGAGGTPTFSSHGGGAAGTYYGSPVNSGKPAGAGTNSGGDGYGDGAGTTSAGIVCFYYT